MITRTLVRLLAVAGLAGAGFAAFGLRGDAQEGRTSQGTEPWMKPVPRATCGPKDRGETGLQGQTTLAERMTGASERAYNCNLELVGQVRGEGASWQMTA